MLSLNPCALKEIKLYAESRLYESPAHSALYKVSSN